MADKQPLSDLPRGAQDDPDGIRLKDGESLVVKEDYTDPDADSEKLTFDDEGDE